MPFIDNTTAMEQKHTAGSESNVYSYSSLTLNASLTDAAQIQVRYIPTTIYVGNTQAGGGTATATNSLSSRILELLTVIPTTSYTVNASDNTVTFTLSSLQNTVRQLDGINYYYGASLSVSTTEPINIRRATSLNDKSVSFQAGSRLTSTSLNLAVDQLFNASQELTAFGSLGGEGTNPDELSLAGYSIQDLGDVNTFSSAGPLTWNTGTNKVEIGASGTVPTPGGSDSGKYLGATDALGNFGWVAFDIQGANVAYDVSNSVNDKINANIANISSNDTDITNLQNKTAGLAYDASTGSTFTGNITNGASNITTTGLTASTATIGGFSITDRFFFASKTDSSIKTSEISGANPRNLFAPNDLESNWNFMGSTEGISSYTTTGNAREQNYILIPRDMTVRLVVTFAISGSEVKPYGGGFVAPYKNVDFSLSNDRTTLQPYKIGNAHYNYIYNQSSTSLFFDVQTITREWILDLNANDKLSVLFWKWGESDSNFSDVKLRYGSLSIEEIFPPSLSTGTIGS